MSKLTADQRRRIPKSEMGVPGKATAKGGAVSGSFPMPDKNHARAALAEIGHAAPSERARIRAKARSILGAASEMKP